MEKMERYGRVKVESPSRLLTVKEVAQLLHAHPNTVRHWSNDGLLKVYRVGHRHDQRFKPEDINSFLKGERQTEN